MYNRNSYPKNLLRESKSSSSLEPEEISRVHLAVLIRDNPGQTEVAQMGK